MSVLPCNLASINWYSHPRHPRNRLDLPTPSQAPSFNFPKKNPQPPLSPLQKSLCPKIPPMKHPLRFRPPFLIYHMPRPISPHIHQHPIFRMRQFHILAVHLALRVFESRVHDDVSSGTVERVVPEPGDLLCDGFGAQEGAHEICVPLVRMKRSASLRAGSSNSADGSCELKMGWWGR